MGFLHEGHLSLMREGGAPRGRLCGDIFVEPDAVSGRKKISRATRATLAGDRREVRERRRRGGLAPEAGDVYPPGLPDVVNVEDVTQGLDGGVAPAPPSRRRHGRPRNCSLVPPRRRAFVEKDFPAAQVIKGARARPRKLASSRGPARCARPIGSR